MIAPCTDCVRQAKAQRLAAANRLLQTIAQCGRRFFLHHGTVSQLELDQRGRVWFIDSDTTARVYTHDRQGRWRGFTEGGTLRSLIEELRAYITHGSKLSRGTFGPWPSWFCEGDLWGYGPDMEGVRQEAHALGLIDAPPGPHEPARREEPR